MRNNTLAVNKKKEKVSKKEWEIKEILEIIPRKPGVYIFKDSDDNIIYIGKANNLFNRVRSYFHYKSKYLLYSKPPNFVNKIHSIDYLVTDNETEALILESSLIKKNKPRYNIDLKDDKSYPFIAVTVNEEFPRVFLTRNRNISGAKYFGPYTNASAVRKTVEYLRKAFKIRDCKRVLPGTGAGKPCLSYYINLCSAPCIGNIKKEEYRKDIELIILFLKGKNKNIIDRLNYEMDKYSAEMEFEKAADVRDKIVNINRLWENQKIFFKGGSKWDFITVAKDLDYAVVSLFTYRAGELVLVNNFTLCNTGYFDEKEILSAFIRDYYANLDEIPDKVYCQAEVENLKLMEKWLSRKAGRKVGIMVPKIGDKKRIMEMALKNSVLYIEKKKFEKGREKSEIYIESLNLKKLLGLKNIPLKIECYDISNLKSSFPVGSISVAVGGKISNDKFRHFKIKNVEGQDDCRMIAEVVTRRLRYLKDISGMKENSKKDDIFYQKPDLIVIDGGKAQYNTVRNILIKEQIEDIDVISIAKKEEVIFCDKYTNGIKLDLRESYVRILIKVRDEAHRFAVKYHRQLRDKNMLNSVFDGIKGIGEKKKRIIMESNNSMGELKSMTVRDLTDIKGIGYKDAVKIYRSLHG